MNQDETYFENLNQLSSPLEATDKYYYYFNNICIFIVSADM